MTDLGVAVSASAADVDLAAKGDEVAFARLIEAHHGEMARVAFAIIGEDGLAEDAVQAAWIKAWRKLPTLRDSSRIRYWLLSICANESRQTLRRNRRVRVVEFTLEQPAADGSDPADTVGRLDLRRALALLPTDDRALLALRYVAGLDANELASLTGRSPSGTRTRLSRLTAKLRGDLTR